MSSARVPCLLVCDDGRCVLLWLSTTDNPADKQVIENLGKFLKKVLPR